MNRISQKVNTYYCLIRATFVTKLKCKMCPSNIYVSRTPHGMIICALLTTKAKLLSQLTYPRRPDVGCDLSDLISQSGRISTWARGGGNRLVKQGSLDGISYRNSPDNQLRIMCILFRNLSSDYLFPALTHTYTNFNTCISTSSSDHCLLILAPDIHGISQWTHDEIIPITVGPQLV